jgi:predicted component of type VI protein secretion system
MDDSEPLISTIKPTPARPLRLASTPAEWVPPRFWLHVDGELRGQIVLDGEGLVLGRGPACDVQLDDATTSTDHLELTRHGGAVIATDLGSRNGTLLNGRPLDRATRLRHGDTLELGRTRLQLVLPPVAGVAGTEPAAAGGAKLSDQERDVAAALVAPFRVAGALAPRPARRAEIAAAVHLSERTVQRRLDGLSVKLGLPAHAPRERAHLLAQRILERGIDAQR